MPETEIPYIDIHTHHHPQGEGVISVKNLFPEDARETENEEHFYSIGIHPWYITEHSDLSFTTVVTAASLSHVLAIGESGADRYRDQDLTHQLLLFRKHAELSETISKPLIIHCVKAFPEILEIRKEMKSRMPWIFHGYNANTEIAARIISAGCYLSFGWLLFQSNSQAVKTFSNIDLDHVFLETDDSGYGIVEVYQQAGTLRGIDFREIKAIIFANFKKCFPHVTHQSC